MRREPRDEVENIGDPIFEMGPERMALRARKATVLLTVVCSFVCLGTALAGFTGYVLPYSVGPAFVFLVTAVVGFVLSVTLAERPR